MVSNNITLLGDNTLALPELKARETKQLVFTLNHTYMSSNIHSLDLEFAYNVFSTSAKGEKSTSLLNFQEAEL
jgi:hypothetical protein